MIAFTIRRNGFQIFQELDDAGDCLGTQTVEGDEWYDAEESYISDQDNPGRRQNNSNISRISSLFTEECDKIINLAILKDHGLAGVTLALKNLAYGFCDNNARFHGRDHIGPFIADFCSRSDVRNKVVLHLIDGW